MIVIYIILNKPENYISSTCDQNEDVSCLKLIRAETYRWGAQQCVWDMMEMKKVKKQKWQKIWPSPFGIQPQVFEQNFPVQYLNFDGD